MMLTVSEDHDQQNYSDKPELRIRVQRNCSVIRRDKVTQVCWQILVETDFSEVERFADKTLVEDLHADVASHLGV